jgi:hypothetical protein
MSMFKLGRWLCLGNVFTLILLCYNILFVVASDTTISFSLCRGYVSVLSLSFLVVYGEWPFFKILFSLTSMVQKWQSLVSKLNFMLLHCLVKFLWGWTNKMEELLYYREVLVNLLYLLFWLGVIRVNNTFLPS